MDKKNSAKDLSMAMAVARKNRTRYATGGMVEDSEPQHDSIASAILARRQTVAASEAAEDLDESFDDASMKESYDYDLGSVSQPMGLNEAAQERPTPRKSKVEAIRSRMKNPAR